MKLIDELTARGLIHQMTEHEERPLARLLDQPQTVYAGFDPSADSLHVGNLIPLLGLRRFQLAGHRPVALAGGATGMVGDPSGKSEERNLLAPEVLAGNLARIKQQLERFLDFGGPSGAVLVDNLDWTRELTFLEVLREIGKHFHVNVMIRKDSVRTRLEREGEGMSYTEFSYSLLQAYDFLHLFQSHDCKLQVGGSDQWGNIVSGVELIRRKLGQSAYGLTFPLLMNSDGSKFGKSAAGAVWLDPSKTSPFAFRQFWYGTTDADVIDRLKYFTFLPLEEIAALEQKVADKSEPNAAQRALARAMTALVHGEAEADKVERAAALLFDKEADLRDLPLEYLADAFAGAEQVRLPRERLVGEGLSLIDLVVATVHGGGQAKSAARRDIQQGSVAINRRKLQQIEARLTTADLLHDRFLVVSKGKKSHWLVEVTA